MKLQEARTKMRLQISPAIYSVVLLGLAAALIYSSGCEKSTAPNNDVATQSSTSKIAVRTDSDGIHVDTPTAEFVLTSSGYLKSSLKSDGHTVTLDDPATETGQHLSIAGRDTADLKLDLSSAKISEAQGKLGRHGKHIEVSGTTNTTPDTKLNETITLEVYDDFPNLALLSATLENTGQSAVALGDVSLQRHRLNAQLTDSTAAPHEMFSFFGSSLEWGKNEILPIPAKFEQQNPFGAPVELKQGDDLGRVGGGIPVVAFWTRTMGEAIGHLETLPLVINIPVQTTKDGRVEASVTIPAKTTLKPGEKFSTPRTFVAVYKGDYYEPLNMWSNAVEREGLTKPDQQQRKLRRELVRLGLPLRSHPQANARHHPETKRTRHPLGHARRSLVQQLRRLAAAPRHFPQ